MDCLIIINTLQSTKLQNFMDKFGLQRVLFETTTIHNS
jgi:hypothetical protein